MANLPQFDRIAVVDVETTGLFPGNNDRIVEIAIVLTSTDGQIHGEYETLVNPERDMGPQSIHRITAGEVLGAPRFREIAGDVIDLLQGAQLVAGHNIGFDRRFLIGEYKRLDVSLPDFSCFCTYQSLGRNNLRACCEEFGISFDGEPHWAIHDARATARLIQTLAQRDPAILEGFTPEHSQVEWPPLPKLGTAPVTRRAAQERLGQQPSFLQRIVARVRHDVEATPSDILAYLALVDRVLEDRTIDTREANALLDAATQLNLAPGDVQNAHRNYIQSLAVHALADSMITDAEHSDLHEVARLLGHNQAELDAILEATTKKLRSVTGFAPRVPGSDEMRGKTVCFTGELQSRIDGVPISRNLAEALAERAGLAIASNVSKKLDLLVVADPNTQSGKAAKARLYGVRIMAEPVFWKTIGVAM